jgi:hypothetical protein
VDFRHGEFTHRSRQTIGPVQQPPQGIAAAGCYAIAFHLFGLDAAPAQGTAVPLAAVAQKTIDRDVKQHNK